MPSSTSGSRPAHAAIVLLIGCIAIALGIEVVARVGFDRVSRIQGRMAEEYREALTFGRGRSKAADRVLMVGNSLLDEDVRFDDVRAALAPDWDARRFVVEQTFYLDWYYGLRRLFSEGVRPDVVVVMLSARQWVRDEIRGDYSAQYLMSAADTLAAARDLRLNATQTADLAVSSVSKFWGARAEMRNFVLGHLMPDLGPLMDLSSEVDTRTIEDGEIAAAAVERIARVKTLTDANDAQLVILVPAMLNPKDGGRGLLRAASDAGVAAVRPVQSGELGARLYRDSGFHLNAAGASEFTARLIPALRQRLKTVRTAARIQ